MLNCCKSLHDRCEGLPNLPQIVHSIIAASSENMKCQICRNKYIFDWIVEQREQREDSEDYGSNGIITFWKVVT